MANFIVVSPGQSTTGGDSGDLFVFRSGAASGATLVGGTGADTVQLLEGGSAKGGSLKPMGGADQLQFSGVDLSAAVIAAGAGKDTVTFSGNSIISDLALGDGSDAVTFKGTQDLSLLKGGAGADDISGNALISASGASILMGAGNDTVNLTAILNSGNVVGGGGADVFAFHAQGSNDFTIRGGAGGDSLQISAALDSSQILGGNGSDVITAFGDFTNTGAVLGGKGSDLLALTAVTFTNFVGGSIGGGAGSDTIELGEFGSAGSGAIVLGWRKRFHQPRWKLRIRRSRFCWCSQVLSWWQHLRYYSRWRRSRQHHV